MSGPVREDAHPTSPRQKVFEKLQPRVFKGSVRLTRDWPKGGGKIRLMSKDSEGGMTQTLTRAAGTQEVLGKL